VSIIVDDKDNNFYFGLVVISSYLFYINFNNKNNSWLIDTGVTNYITYNIANFLNYIKINNLDIIIIVNSLVRLKGIGIVWRGKQQQYVERRNVEQK
jgi:hypothetical protein